MNAKSLSLDLEEAHNIDPNNMWALVQNKLKLECGEATYNSWLSKLRVVSFMQGQLLLIAPTKFMREWINAHYIDIVKRIWNEIEPNLVSIDIIIASNPSANYNPLAETITPIKPSNFNLNDEPSLLSLLDRRFNFDNFVVGAPNELAYAAARSVADSAEVKSESNPLFLYGGVGLGKTHLMHAIAWHINNNDKKRKVIYMSAEKFMYKFVKALREKDIIIAVPPFLQLEFVEKIAPKKNFFIPSMLLLIIIAKLSSLPIDRHLI